MAAELKGIVPPLLTPLNEDGTLDRDGLEKLINYQISAGVNGIFLFGSCGEGSFFTGKMRKEITEAAIEIIDHRVPILIGILENTTSKVIDAIHMIDDLDIDYYVIVAPYYIPATQQMVLKHVQMISKETERKILMYNIPAFVNMVISPETMAELCRIPNVVGCKDTNCSWPTVQRELYLSKREGFILLVGDEDNAGVGMLLGAEGEVPGTANAYPEFFVEFYKAAAAGDVKKVYEMQDAMDKFKEVMRNDIHWIPRLKYLAARKGLIKECVADPLIALTQAEKDQMEEVLARTEKYMTV